MTEPFETLGEMRLKHLPNDTRLLVQRQRGSMIPDNAIQFGLPTTFVTESGRSAFVKGPSIQLEQIPELIKILTDVYQRYHNKTEETSNDTRTYTFGDLV